METFQILPSAPPQEVDVIQMEGEPNIGDPDFYLRDTISSINKFTDVDTGFPLSVFDPARGSYDSQTPLTNIGDIGRSILATAEIGSLRKMPYARADHRIHQVLAILESVLIDPDCYENGLFTKHLRPDGLRNTEYERSMASPEQHAQLLKGLGIVNGAFPPWQGFADELTKRILFGIKQSGRTLPDLDDAHEMPDRIEKVPLNIARPADIMQGLVGFPAETLQRLRYLREQYPGIYIEGMGFMHEVNTDTGEINAEQHFKDQYEILFYLCKYKDAMRLKEMQETAPPNYSNDDDLPEFESELLQVA